MIRRIIELIYPRRCPFCFKCIPVGSEVCTDCIDLPYVDCVNYDPHAVFHFDKIAASFFYEDKVKNAIYRMKKGGQRILAAELAKYMSLAIRREFKNISFDIIIYVPMTKEDISERGFNQAKDLAKHISKYLKIPVAKNALYKVENKRHQKELNAEERWKNAAGGYICRTDCLAEKTVLLIDDVMTTGATLNECSKTLKTAGAKEVFCAVIAMTRYKKMKNKI